MISPNDIIQRPIVDIALIKKTLGCDDHYASLVLSRLQQRSLLKKITRNKYTAIQNIYVFATQLYIPCYLSFWSACAYLGYTEQILNTLQIVTTSRRKSISFEHYTIKFIVLPKQYFFGFTKIQTTDGVLFVAEPEKLIIDAFLRHKEIGNFDEIIKIVQNSSFDTEKLVNYLLLTKNISIMKRVGFLVEKYKNKDLYPLLNIKDKNYISLNPFTKDNKEIISKWRITT